MTKKILSVEDSHLFRQTIGSVRSIKNDKVTIGELNKPKPIPKQRRHTHEDALITLLPLDINTVGTEDVLSFISAGVPKNRLTKLRAGYFIPEAEMDMHGLNSHDAHQQLLHFLAECVKWQCHCVHIVHGKGYRSQDNYPILKNQINLWLRQHKDVQAFCSALPKDGGTGAVYVLLSLS